MYSNEQNLVLIASIPSTKLLASFYLSSTNFILQTKCMGK